MKDRTARIILLFAFLAVGLLLDPMGILRMTLLCAAVHESGHILTYAICLRRFPRLTVEPGGVSLHGVNALSKRQELTVAAAGPLANFLMTALLLLRVRYRASYRLYFLAAVSLCMGLYNMLPFGVLDGARILQDLLPAERQNAFQRVQRVLLCSFCIAVICFVLFGRLPRGARLTGLLGSVCLLTKEFGKHDAM